MTARPRVAADLALAIAFAAAIGAVNIWRSTLTGRLSAPPAYDDVVYLASARRWIVDLGVEPFIASVRALVDQHAPLWTWVAIVGFVASGGSEAGPYGAASALLVGYFFALLSMLRPFPPAIAWPCVGAIATLPFVQHVATEFRPDLIHGASLGLCAVALLIRPMPDRSRSGQFLLGAMGGLLLVAKPTAFLPTAALIGAALVMRIVLDKDHEKAAWNRAFFAKQAAAALWFCLGALLVAGPTFAVRYAQIFDYVYGTLVTRRDVWRLEATFAEHLRFYSVGFGGRFALGNALWVALATFVLRSIAAVVARDRADLLVCAALGVLVAFAYAMPTVTDVKTYFLGSLFYGTLVAAAVSNVVSVGRRISLPHRLASARVPLLVAVAIAWSGAIGYRLYRNPVPLATVFPPDEAENYRVSTARIWQVIRNLARDRARVAGAASPFRVMFNSPVPTNPTVITFYASAELPLRIAASSIYLESDIERVMSMLPRWDVIVLASSIAHPLPGPRMGDALIARLDQRADFALVEAFPQRPGGVVRIYERRAP